MTTYSTIFQKYYDDSNVVYISNPTQVYKYLNASQSAAKCLVDIIYSGTKNNGLVFVFEKTDIIKDLYNKWNKHELG